MTRKIPFAVPDIGQAEIDAVVETLRSGWITTGPRVAEFERRIAEYCGAESAVCVSSATAGLELVLRFLDIGPGDEVITSPYSFASVASAVVRVGAEVVFVDTAPDSFEMDLTDLRRAVTPHTRAVVAVDFAGLPCDYQALRDALADAGNAGSDSSGRTSRDAHRQPVLIADAAHSFGATLRGARTGSLADFTVFSFHAVKNLTTAEGGAIVFNGREGRPAREIHDRFAQLALHGQSMGAFARSKAGRWRYDIELPGHKYNLTDIAASLGLAQLARYDSEILPARERIARLYEERLCGLPRAITPQLWSPWRQSNFHLYPLRIAGAGVDERDALIDRLAECGISTNVHYVPVVMQSAYARRGHSIEDFPNAYRMYANEISLPIYPSLSRGDQLYVCDTLESLIS